MGLSAEDKALLAQLRAEQESETPPEDKVNGKRRTKGTPDQEDAPTPGARTKAKPAVIDVEADDEDEVPADKKPTKAPPAPKRTRRAAPAPEPVEDEPAAVVPELDTIQLGPTPRQTLAMMALPVACEFASKDADLSEVVGIALEFADAVMAAK